MYVRGEKAPLILRLPIIIGNIPLKKNFTLLANAEEVSSTTKAPVIVPKHILHRYFRLRKY